MGVRQEGKTYTLDLMGHVNQQIYSMYFGLTNNNQDVTLNLSKSFSELITFQITDIFTNYPEPDTFAALFGNTYGRMRYWRNGFNLTGTFEANKHYMIRIVYSNQFSKYFYTHTRQWYINNYISMNYSNQELKYSLNQGARIQHEVHWDSSNYSYLFYEYQWTKSFPGGVLQVHRPGIGYRHDFTKQLYIEGRVAPDIVFPPTIRRTSITAFGTQIYLSSGTPYDVSLYAYIMLGHNIDQRTNAALSFTYQNSVLANNADPTTNWQIQGTLSRNIIDKLMLTSSIFYGQAYLFTSKTTIRLFGFSISPAFEFTENISMSVSYSFTLNYSHISGQRIPGGYVLSNTTFLKQDTGYYRNRASIGVNASW